MKRVRKEGEIPFGLDLGVLKKRNRKWQLYCHTEGLIGLIYSNRQICQLNNKQTPNPILVKAIFHACTYEESNSQIQG